LLADTPQKPNHTESNLQMKSIFEQLGGTYHEENGYLIPDLRLHTEEELSMGIWGERVPVALKLRTDRAGRRENGIWTI
jgi:hypothetical protein